MAMGPEKKGIESTSIVIFQRDESLAGLVTRNSDLTDADFLVKNNCPVLLTSMPTEVGLTAWTVVLPIKRKEPRGKAEETLSKTARGIWQEAIAYPNRFIIGRAPECDIVLAPRSISRRHAAFELQDDVWYVTDLRSSNGTRLDGVALAPSTSLALGAGPVKIELGTDTILWYVSQHQLLEYMRGLQRQVPDTGRYDTRAWAVTPRPPVSDATPVDGVPTISKIDKEKLRQAEDDEARRRKAEAETNPLLRYADPSSRAHSTWHDGSTDESIPLPAKAPKAKLPKLPPRDPYAPSDLSNSSASRAVPIPKSGEIEPKLLAAIRAIAALDSLILSVTARLKSDSHAMTLFSADGPARLVDVPDQMMRMGPLLKTVHVALCVGDGTPVEVYADA